MKRSQKYEVIPAVRWERDDGLTASIYGGVPWTSSEEKSRWKRKQTGYTVRNVITGAVGIGRMPFSTRAEADDWLKG